MDVSDQCKTYRKSQELPLSTFAFRILLKRRGLSLSEFGVRMLQFSHPGPAALSDEQRAQGNRPATPATSHGGAAACHFISTLPTAN